MRIPSRFLLSLAFAIFAFGLHAQSSLTTTFAGGNGQSCTYFDVCNLGFTAIQISSFDVNFDVGTHNVQVGLATNMPSTHVGNVGGGSMWSIVGTTTVVTTVTNAGTPVPIGGINVPAFGCVGIYVCVLGSTAQNYTNGPAGLTVWNGGNCANGGTVSDGTIGIFAGQGGALPPGTGTAFCPRIFNGTVNYITNLQCVAPSGVTTTVLDQSSIEVDWTSVSNNLVNSTIVYVPCGLDPLTSPLAQSVVGVSPPTTITGLNRDQCYDFYVFDNCSGSTATSDTSDAAQGTPVCVAPPNPLACPYPTPYWSETFSNFAISDPVSTTTASSGGTWTYIDPDGTNAPNWSAESNGGNSPGTGPGGGNAGSCGTQSVDNYLEMETSGATAGEIVTLISPSIPITGTAPFLTFFYHMFGPNMGTLEIQVSTTGVGGPFTTIWSLSGQQQTAQNDPWLSALVSMAPYIGQNIHIAIHGISGPSFTADASVDDLAIADFGGLTLFSDLEVVALVSPENGDCNCEGVLQVELANTGQLSINGGNVAVNVSGSLNTTIATTFTDTITPGTSIIIDAGTINTCAGGTYTIDIAGSIASDPNLCNDSLSIALVIPAPTIPNPTIDPTCQIVEPGASALFQVQNPTAGQVYRWYDGCGGNLIHEGVNFPTDPIFANSTFGLVCQPVAVDNGVRAPFSDLVPGTAAFDLTTGTEWGMNFTVAPNVTNATLNTVNTFVGTLGPTTGTFCADLWLVNDPLGSPPSIVGTFCQNLTTGGGITPLNFGGVPLIPGGVYNIVSNTPLSNAFPIWFHPWAGAIGDAPHVYGNITMNGYVSSPTQVAPSPANPSQLDLGVFFFGFDISSSIEDCPSDCVNVCVNLAAQTVPTVGQWGLMMLMVLLVSFSIVFIGRPQHAFAMADGRTLRYMPENLTGPFPFVNEIYHKAMAIVLAMVMIGFILSLVLTGVITNVDIIGAFIITPFAAYLFHLIWIFDKSDQSK